MAIEHAQAGDVIDIRPLAEKLPESRTHTLLKTEHVEVLRLVLPAGKTLAEHKAPSDITVQCLEGEVKFTSPIGTKALHAGEMLYLNAAEPHAVEAISNASLLVTILLRSKAD
ncbi:MAG: cupin domain-containing protein [Aureliella sp.]